MGYFVEPLESPANYSEPAVYLVPQQETLERHKLRMISLTLGAMSLSKISEENGLLLIGKLSDNTNFVDDYHAEALNTLHACRNNAARRRRNDVTKAAMTGNLTAQQLRDEIALLPPTLTFDPAYSYFVTKEGLGAFLDEDGRFEVELDVTEGMFGKDSLEVQVARELGLSDQYALNHQLVWNDSQPEVTSDIYHTALGTIDNAGNFNHVVTVFNDAHPLRQPRSQSPEAIVEHGTEDK